MLLELLRDELQSDFNKFNRDLVEEARKIDVQKSAKMFGDRYLEDDSDQEPNTILRSSRMPRGTRRLLNHKGDGSDKGEALVDSSLKKVIEKMAEQKEQP